MRLGRCEEWLEVWLAGSCEWLSSGVNTMASMAKHLHQWPEKRDIIHCYHCHMWRGAGSRVLQERPLWGEAGAALCHTQPVPAGSSQLQQTHRRAPLSPSAISEAFSCLLTEYALSFHISDFKRDFTVCTSSCRCKCWYLHYGPVSVNTCNSVLTCSSKTITG